MKANKIKIGDKVKVIGSAYSPKEIEVMGDLFASPESLGKDIEGKVVWVGKSEARLDNMVLYRIENLDLA